MTRINLQLGTVNLRATGSTEQLCSRWIGSFFFGHCVEYLSLKPFVLGKNCAGLGLSGQAICFCGHQTDKSSLDDKAVLLHICFQITSSNPSIVVT